MLYILQTVKHTWHFEQIIGRRPKMQSLTAHTNPHVWKVCARRRHRGANDQISDKNPKFYCFDAMFTKSHVSHWLQLMILFFIWLCHRPCIQKPHNNKEGSTCNRCACTRFETLRQPLSHRDSRRWNYRNLKINYELVYWCNNSNQRYDIKWEGMCPVTWLVLHN